MKLQIDKNNRVIGWSYEGQINGAIEYTDEIPSDFDTCGTYYKWENNSMVYHDELKQAELQQLGAEDEIRELTAWFGWYDKQVMQFNRCVRLGMEFDRDMSALDLLAVENQERIRALRGD